MGWNNSTFSVRKDHCKTSRNKWENKQIVRVRLYGNKHHCWFQPSRRIRCPFHKILKERRLRNDVLRHLTGRDKVAKWNIQSHKEAPTQPPLLLLKKEPALSAQWHLALPAGAMPPDLDTHTWKVRPPNLCPASSKRPWCCLSTFSAPMLQAEHKQQPLAA